VAALVNASATGRYLAKLGSDVTLLCAGTDGQPAPEDQLGAGAVAHAVAQTGSAELSSAAAEAVEFFCQSRASLSSILRSTAGGQNILRAGLEPDIDFAARLDAFDVVAEASGDPPVVRRMIEPH
jgi:2-phosphosulfolactate phosphatase